MWQNGSIVEKGKEWMRRLHLIWKCIERRVRGPGNGIRVMVDNPFEDSTYFVGTKNSYKVSIESCIVGQQPIYSIANVTQKK